jgi:hypothetical protein
VMYVQGTNSGGAGGIPPSQSFGGFTLRKPRSATPSEMQPQSQQPPTLRQATMEKIVLSVPRGSSPAQKAQLTSGLSPQLRGDVYHAMTVQNLTELPRYRADIVGIPAAQMTREPFIGYRLPEQYSEYPNLPNYLDSAMNYAIGGGYKLRGNNGAAWSIRGPNGFKLFFGPRGIIYQFSEGRTITLNESTPYQNKAQMMKALELAANSARRGLGPVLGTPVPSAIL